MYYHGAGGVVPPRQATRLAVSSDGLTFAAREPVLGASYWRTFEWHGWHYALAMPGRFYRSPDGLDDWEEGPQAFSLPGSGIADDYLNERSMRHSAVRVTAGELAVFYSTRGDSPERILLSTIRLTDNWLEWRPSDPVEVVSPEMDYEGAEAPHVASRNGAIHQPAWQLRDPALFEEGDKVYLLYSVAGEHGIAIARLYAP